MFLFNIFNMATRKFKITFMAHLIVLLDSYWSRGMMELNFKSSLKLR